mmetsp:Transcript_84386/g.217327  ORF Transcript_84386/g.217327 Transcript_84386/m.217327 type:complete len:295 (-) Transcript_84386:103-987(-)
MRVVDQLARHARADHAVAEGDGVVAVPVGALVGATKRLAAHVDLHKRALELGLSRLGQQAKVILRNLLQLRDVHRACGVAGSSRRLCRGRLCRRRLCRRRLCRRRRLLLRSLCLRGTQDAKRLHAHNLSHLGGLRKVLCGNVREARVGGVILAEGCQALGDADAGAVELAHDPLLLLRRRALRGRKDEVRRPPKRDRLLRKAKARHHMRQVPLQEVRRQALEQRLLRTIEGVDGASATHRRDATILRLLVDDAHERVADHVVPQLALHDARAEALVHKQASSLLAALKVLAGAR